MELDLRTAAFLVGLGFIPSLIWLSLFLKEDPHPEPKRWIIRILLLGIAIAPLVAFFEWLLQTMLGYGRLPKDELTARIYTFFLVAAFIEEYFKYWAVKVTVLHSPEFDEPVDAMIYLITAALGFAAIENILVLFQVLPDGLGNTFGTLILRFFGATLLHALSSAFVGYFLALAWLRHQHRKKIVAAGLLVATIVHFSFNTAIVRDGDKQLGAIILGLFIIAVAVFILFSALKKRLQAPRRPILV